MSESGGRRPRGPRRALTENEILDAALSLLDHGPDAAPGVVPDRLLTVQNAGNGRDRDGRGAGDVADGHRQRAKDRWKSACVIVYIEPIALCNSVRRDVSSAIAISTGHGPVPAGSDHEFLQTESSRRRGAPEMDRWRCDGQA